MDYGPQLGRRFRALKLWFVLRAYGVEGLRNLLRRHIELASQFEDWVAASSDFEMMAPRIFSTVCFRARPAQFRDEGQVNALNRRLLTLVNESGEAYLSRTELHGQFTLRLAIGHMRTEAVHVEVVKDLLIRLLPQAVLSM